MRRQTFEIEGRECICYGEKGANRLLIQPLDAHGLRVLDKEVEYMEEERSDFLLLGFCVEDWFADLTPWKAPAMMGKNEFGDGGQATLDLIMEKLIPEMKDRYDLPGDVTVILGGYSLAGLFALWSSYQTDQFAAIAAVSPSVWYSDWIGYASQNAPKTRIAYLSLGDREDQARNPVIAEVAEHIRMQQDLLESQGITTTLEWNEGNHFRNPDERTARGFLWCLEQL